MYWNLKRRGKVRDIYESTDGKYVALVATDRVSAFDRMLPVVIKDKDIMITQLSEFFMDLTKDVIPNAQLFYYGNETLYEEFSIEQGINMESVTIQKKLTMLPIECIVRLYLTGSAWRKYAKGEREKCGIIMPDGLHESERFPEILFTPTTKNNDGEDEDITFNQMVGILNEAGYDGINLANKIKRYAIMNANIIADYCDARGIILADIKTEFGVDEDGNVYMADENGTFDCARFANKDTYEVGKPLDTYDKEIIRQHLLKQEKAGIENPVPSQEIIDYSIARYKELITKLAI